ncbi:MAG: NADH-quinone oxidoreductase subunit L [Streptosporangiales bacterium]|nr:NADH-quinone oxidoreductase subunit L [Streptosporangiales bacterium]
MSGGAVTIAAEALEPAAASGAFSLTWLLVAIPLASAAVLLLGGRRTDRWGHLLGCAASLAPFVIGVVLFVSMLGLDPEHRSVQQELFTWAAVGDFQVQWGFLVDPLSICFVLLITGVGSLIHIYSIGYMEHDPNRRRFFAYLNLFIAAMLLLVLGDNYLMLYIGWEGVGLASYLLIGFWQHKPAAAVAAKKAFVVNRVGDFGLSVAVFLMFSMFGAVSFTEVFAGVDQANTAMMTAVGLLILLGATGKSAQVPLQSWLLDAMEGPTPVSALIHAATMVTAGVYLIVRSNPVFEAAPYAQLVVCIVGAVTLLFGAIIGCAKDDIKKSLAGSTMSQIGYMHLAAGLGPLGYAFAIAHLLGHGTFKAVLFLGAGSVMHATNDQVDMRKFGGLRKKMPITFWTFMLAWAAIIGVPLFAGWWSKDKIIEAAFAYGPVGGWFLGGAAALGAAITAFYMTRMIIMTFFGKERWDDDVHPHESPAVMTVPLIILSVGSVFGGWFLIGGDRLAHFLDPVVGETHHGHLPFAELTLQVGMVVLVALGVLLAWLMYGRRSVPEVAPAGNALVVAGRRDLYGDAFNEGVFMRPGQYLTRSLVYFDNKVVDGAVRGIAGLFGGASLWWRQAQTGFVRSYALSMLLGAAVVSAMVLIVVVI